MKIESRDIEAKLVDLVKSLKGEVGGHYAIHFHFAKLQTQYKSEFQLRIAINILNDVFRDRAGFIFVAGDADVFVIYYGEDRSLIDKAIFQLRYLFLDDPLANHKDGSENENFSDVYDLAFQWRSFYKICTVRMGDTARDEITMTEKADSALGDEMNPSRLGVVVDELSNIDISVAMRKQPICAIKKKGEVTPVFHEMYVNIGHLCKMMDHDYNLFSRKWLFNYLTEELDKAVMGVLQDRPNIYLDKAISMNLNISTILSDDFTRFCERIAATVNTKIVVEVHVADVFNDMRSFYKAKDIIHGYGHKICLDGLSKDSFSQIDRRDLGFDLAKLRWNADFAADINREDNARLLRAIEKCGSNRMILCRCESEHAIDYGKILGISLFQGRYPDRVLDPDALIIN